MHSPLAHASTRIEWLHLPPWLRQSLEGRFGARVLEAVTQPGGFSPGLAVRVRLTDGRRAFVKAVGAEPNTYSPELHRREASVAARLPAKAPAPRFLWHHEERDWVALAFEEVEGACPGVPWRTDELSRVLEMLTRLAEVLTPAPVAVEPLTERFGDWFSGWQKLAELPDAASRLDAWTQRHLARLAVLEQDWAAAVSGTTLLHADLRADNLLLTDSAVLAVDWAWACTGAAWFDLLMFLVSVAAQGGPPPEPLFQQHPLGASAEAAAVDTVLAAVAGFFTERSLAPPEPGLPGLREFQRVHAAAARDWLATRLGRKGP